MSTDARDSIQLWASGLAIFGVIWAAWHFNWFDGMSGGWFGSIAGVIGFANLALFFHGLWRRRDANPDNPNRH